MGLVVLDMLGLEHTESPRPVSGRGKKRGRKLKMLQDLNKLIVRIQAVTTGCWQMRS